MDFASGKSIRANFDYLCVLGRDDNDAAHSHTDVPSSDQDYPADFGDDQYQHLLPVARDGASEEPGQTLGPAEHSENSPAHLIQHCWSLPTAQNDAPGRPLRRFSNALVVPENQVTGLGRTRPAPTAESQILDAATVPFYLEGTNHKAGDAVFDQTFATNDSLDDFLSKNENWFIRPAEFHDEQSNPMGANSSFRAMVGSSGGPCGCRSSPMTPGAAQPTHGIVMPDSRMETIPLACGGLGQADPQNPAPPLTPPRGRRQVPAPPLVVRQQRLQTAHQQPVAPQQGSLPTNTNAAQVPGNKVGQTPGYPQALRLHKRFCKPADSCEVADGCKADCPLLIEFPEKHAEMSNTKSRKKACEGKLRLWESHELMYGSDQ